MEYQVIRMNVDGAEGRGLSPLDVNGDAFETAPPVQNLSLFYSDPDRGIRVGVWDSTQMRGVLAPFPGDAFFHVIEGRIEVAGEDGNTVQAAERQCVTFRNGAPVRWLQEGYVRAFFLDYLRPGAPVPRIAQAESAVTVFEPDAGLDALMFPDPFEIDGPMPKQRNRTLFSNDAGNMLAGIWESGPMVSTMSPYPTHEIMHLTEGSISISEPGAEAQVFEAGDTLFIPIGTWCSWTIEDRAKMYYATLETRS